MPSSSFRLITTAIPLILLAALLFVIGLAIRDNPTAALPRLTGTPVTVARATEPVTPPATATPPQAAAQLTPPATPLPTGEPVDAAGAAETPALPQEDTPDATPTRNGTSLALPPATTPTPAGTRIASPFAGERPPTVRIYSNGNFVHAVAVTRSTIWAATGGGVVAWNKTSGGYVKFTTLDGLATNRMVAATVCPLPGLGVLFGSNRGIQIFDTQTGSWKSLNRANSPMRSDEVTALWCDPAAGRLLVAYQRAGLDLFEARSGEWQPIGADALAEDTIRDLAVSPDGETLWLATNNGLVAVSGGEVTRYTVANSPLADNRIEALALDGSGAVWLTSGDTLYRTDTEEWDAYNGAGRGSFPNGRLTGLDVGSDGAIWLGSDQAQLCRFDPGIQGCVTFFSGEEGMSTAPLTGLLINGDGEVFYTTAGGGISYFNGTVWQSLAIAAEPVPGNMVRDLAGDGAGGIWVAASGGAGRIAIEDGAAPRLYTPANSPLPSVDVRVVQPLRSGEVWIGGAGGVSLYNGATWSIYTPADGLAGATVTAIAADAQGRVWVGTTDGLSIWTGTAFFNLTTDNGLPSNDITALESEGEVVWIGTRGGGLLRFQDNQLQLFNVGNSNLPSNNITALAAARGGGLYIGSDTGVAHFHDNTLLGDAGLGAVIVSALAVAPNGEVWTATQTGELFRFDGVTWHPYAAPRLPGLPITALWVDTAGDLWVGAAQGGVARYTP